MQTLKNLGRDFRSFLKIFYNYTRKRILQVWSWLEHKKDIFVDLLVAKRGTYQRPFLHTSVMVLIAGGIVGAPMIANSYPTVAVSNLENFTPPSAVLTSFNDQETLTQISDKPRDTVVAYKVATGDTLSTIGDKFGVSVDSIKWLNPNLKDESLAVGVELNIPPVTGVVYKVQRGDTIYSIAKKFKVDAQQIINWPFNNYTDLDTFSLAAGQMLVVPDGVMPEAAPIYSPQTIAQVGTVPGSGQFIWPTQGTITQRPVSYHMAVDIANNGLPPIMAADSGKVVLVEYLNYGYGRHVIIDHGNGYQTLYGHMSEIYVSVGQAVSKGSVIGRMGSTGRSTGPHLHFEIRKGGVTMNPLGFLK